MPLISFILQPPTVVLPWGLHRQWKNKHFSWYFQLILSFLLSVLSPLCSLSLNYYGLCKECESHLLSITSKAFWVSVNVFLGTENPSIWMENRVKGEWWGMTGEEVYVWIMKDPSVNASDVGFLSYKWSEGHLHHSSRAENSLAGGVVGISIELERLVIMFSTIV